MQRAVFHRHPKSIAKLQAIVFAILVIASVGIGLAGALIMQTIPHDHIGFYLGMGLAAVGFVSFFWSLVGLVINLVEYQGA